MLDIIEKPIYKNQYGTHLMLIIILTKLIIVITGGPLNNDSFNDGRLIITITQSNIGNKYGTHPMLVIIVEVT